MTRERELRLSVLCARPCGRVGLVLLSLAFILCSPPGGLADEPGPDEASGVYFRGLRERRLFRLAESYCHQRLNHGNLSTAQRADLTLELARTLTEHASYVAEPEQTELRNQARAALRAFL